MSKKYVGSNALTRFFNNLKAIFAPITHSHKKSEITDFPTSMPASDVSAWAKASTKPSYTASEVGLDKVDNTSDEDKPISRAVQTALDNKVDKVSGKGLSTNDFTSTLKTKLDGIASGAEVNVQSDWSVTDTTSDAFIKNKPTIPTVNNGQLTIQKNGTNVATFTANQSGNATANITVPTKVSELTNDSGFTTNTGTVTSVKVGSTSYSSSSGVVSLPAYPSVPASLKNPNSLSLKANSETSAFTSYDGSAAKTITVAPSSTAGAFTISDGTTTKTIQLAGKFTDNNTTYESKTAASGGTAVSLVTTGEKYTWNNKAGTSVATTSANGLMSASDKDKLETAVTDINTLFDAVNTKIDKTTYEWSKELACGSNGKVCLGKFGAYDTNITINITSTTSVTYNATIVIQSQNIVANGTGGTCKVDVYGDANNAITPLLSIFRPYGSESRQIEVYANLPGWSKNLVRVQAVALSTGGGTDILTSVSSIPTSVEGKQTVTPTNVLKANFGTSNFTGYTSSNKLSASYISGLSTVATSGSYNDLSNKPTILTIGTGASNAAAGNHTHNYAGSSSAGGAATSANKVNTNLIVKLNSGSTEGTNMFTFNGSTAKTINITPSSIGALGSSAQATDSAKLNGQAASYYLNYNNLTNKPNIPSGVAVDTSLSTTSANAIANKTVTNAIHTIQTDVNTLVTGKSDEGHTHNYAGSSSAGGAASNVNVTNTTPTSATTYYPLYATGVSGSQTVRANADFYYYDAGTWAYLNIGSSSQVGGVTLHQSNGKYVNLAAASGLTANRDITFPDSSGTVALTNGTIANATTATQANKIKIGNSYYTATLSGTTLTLTSS